MVQQDEAAGDRDVLQEHDLLDLIAQVAVEQHRTGDRERGQQAGDDAGAVTGNDGQAAEDFQRNDQRQQRAGDADGRHVAGGAGVGGQLAEAGDDE